jgi:hypothetical protein
MSLISITLSKQPVNRQQMSKLTLESSAFAGHESDGPCTILPGGRPVTAQVSTQTDLEAVNAVQTAVAEACVQTAVGCGRGLAEGGFDSLPSVVSWYGASGTARGQYAGEAEGGSGLAVSEVMKGILSEAGRRVAAGEVTVGGGEEQRTGIAPIQLESRKVNLEITPRSAGVSAAQVVEGVVDRAARGTAIGAVEPGEFECAILSVGGGDSAIRGGAVSERDALLNEIESLKARLAQALELRGDGQVMVVVDGVDASDSVWGIGEGSLVPRYADEESRDMVQEKVIGLWSEVKALTDEKLGWMLRMDELMKEHQK